MALPAYSIECKSVEDIQVALQFAAAHDIQVSIKSSGHTYQGQSTARGSLMLWMRHFPTDGTVKPHTDSCGTAHSAVVSVAGGQNFDDTLFAVKDEYHIQTGTCKSVVLGGGWLMGGGMSYVGRTYGYGVDNVVSFDIVLANGDLVTADACENQDLFWALRGGGGGTFGVVTNVLYTLHDPTPITEVTFEYSSFRVGKEREFSRRWISFVVGMIGTLDRRWSGSYGITRAHLLFAGSKDEALSSEHMADLDGFYSSLNDLDPNFDKPSEIAIEHASWYQYKGGDIGYDNPDFDSRPSYRPPWFQDTFSRVVPIEAIQERPQELIDLLMEMIHDGDFRMNLNYLLGGIAMDVGPEETAIHPAMRRAAMEVKPRTVHGANKLRDFLQSNGYLTSVCNNHHSADEPEPWIDALYGTNYPRLLEIKQSYDPLHRFNPFHGVGWREDVEPSCPVGNDKNYIDTAFFYLGWILTQNIKIILNLFNGYYYRNVVEFFSWFF